MMDSFQKFVPVRTMLPHGFCPEQKHLAWKFHLHNKLRKQWTPDIFLECDGLKGKEKKSGLRNIKYMQ